MRQKARRVLGGDERLIKKLSIVLVTLLAFVGGFSFGITVYKLDLTPIPELRFLKHFLITPDTLAGVLENDVDVHVKKYTKGMPLFSDRDYRDSIGSPELEGLTLIQIPRHFTNKIRIQALEPISVYRMVTSANDNWLIEDYEKTDIKIEVQGASCTHTQVVKKSFPAGIIDLYPGEPIASSPILIDHSNNASLAFAVLVNQRSL